MERFSSLKKGGKGSSGADAAKDQRSVAPSKGKFKLRTTKDPPPQLSTNPTSRETKPKAKFLLLVGAASTEKPSTKPNIFAPNTFIRPLSMDGPSKKSTGFSFMKFQTKSGGVGKMTSEPSGKAAPKAFASTKPLLGKLSVSGLAKKINSAAEVESKSAKEPLKSEGNLLFGFRADTKSFTAKKRKSRTSTSALDETKHYFPNKSSRTGGKSGFAFMARNKEKGTEISSNVEPSFSRVKKTSSVATKASKCTMSKKRGLLLSSADASLALKRLKPMAQTVQLENDNLVINLSSSRRDRCDVIHGDDALGKSRFVPQDSRPIQVSSRDADGVQSSVMPLIASDCREECLSRIEDELAVTLLCTLDDDKEDEFLTRTAAIQDFTDRVGLEQKQLRNRLLDAHADISECLLDALTDLMAEEGGIGIDKLAFDVNINVDVGDAFLQEEIQVLQ